MAPSEIQTLICPKCKTDQAHRSHRRGFKEHLAGLFGMRAYRCRGCGHRFLRYRYAVEPPEPRAASKEREVQATRNAIRWKRKRRELLVYGFGLALFVVFLYYITRERGPSPDGN